MTNNPRRKQRRRRAAQRAARRGTIQTWAILCALIVGVVAIVVVLAIRSDNRTNAAGSDTTATATAFDLRTLTGHGRVRLAQFRGRLLVVNMFASWCTTCDAELPGLRAAAAKLNGKVDFVFVNSNETANGTTMARHHDLFAFPVAADVGGQAGNGLYESLGGVGGSMPLTAFYDASGNPVGVVRQGRIGSRFNDALDRYLHVKL